MNEGERYDPNTDRNILLARIEAAFIVDLLLGHPSDELWTSYEKVIMQGQEDGKPGN